MRFAPLFPRAVRKYARTAIRRWHEPPARLVFPAAGKLAPPSVRVILYGEAWPEWTAALGNANLWRDIGGVNEILRVADTPRVRIPKPVIPQSRSIIIPLQEEHIKNCPQQYLSLFPDCRSVEILGNKALFAQYAEREHIAQFCPFIFKNRGEAVFPLILKRVDLFGGAGIEIIKSPQHLSDVLEREMWNGKEVILQSIAYGPIEYVTHSICMDGQMLWNCSFSYEMNSLDEIRMGANQKSSVYIPSDEILSQINQLLMPLRYTGPCNVNYKISEKGEIIVFEINPRFGGSLMRPENIAHLKDALSCIIKNARPSAI